MVSRTILSRVRLPIPPQRLIGFASKADIYSIITFSDTQVFFKYLTKKNFPRNHTFQSHIHKPSFSSDN